MSLYQDRLTSVFNGHDSSGQGLENNCLCKVKTILRSCSCRQHNIPPLLNTRTDLLARKWRPTFGFVVGIAPLHRAVIWMFPGGWPIASANAKTVCFTGEFRISFPVHVLEFRSQEVRPPPRGKSHQKLFK